MVNFNLYPWRDAQARYEFNLLRNMLGITLGTMASLAIIVHAMLLWRIHQTSRVITQLRMTLSNADYASQMTTSLTDEMPTPQIKLLFNLLSQLPTQQMCLIAVMPHQQAYDIAGITNSLASVHAVMAAWKKAGMTLQIENITQQTPNLSFQLHVQAF